MKLPGAAVTDLRAMEAHLSSGDLARATGNTVRTIRFYEEQGLLRPTVVSGARHRHRRYTQDDLERLRLILDLRELGLALCEIRAFIDLRAGCRSAAEFALRFREVLLRHLHRAEERLQRVRRVRRELRQALTTLQTSLPLGAGGACTCAIAAAGGAPRIVRVLAPEGACERHPASRLEAEPPGRPAARTGRGELT